MLYWGSFPKLHVFIYIHYTFTNLHIFVLAWSLPPLNMPRAFISDLQSLCSISSSNVIPLLWPAPLNLLTKLPHLLVWLYLFSAPLCRIQEPTYCKRYGLSACIIKFRLLISCSRRVVLQYIFVLPSHAFAPSITLRLPHPSCLFPRFPQSLKKMFSIPFKKALHFNKSQWINTTLQYGYRFAEVHESLYLLLKSKVVEIWLDKQGIQRHKILFFFLKKI